MTEINGLDFLSNAQLRTKPKANEIELSVFGRGFGECIVMSFGNDEYIVIDSFINPDTKNPIAVDYLNSIGVPLSAITTVVLTHWHADHIAGISNLLNLAGENTKIVLSPIMKKDKFNEFINLGIKEHKNSTSEFEKVYSLIEKRGTRIIKIANNDTRIYVKNTEPKVEIFSLSPQDEDLINFINNIIISEDKTTSCEYLEDNLLSIVLLVKFTKDGFLLGSDLENTTSNNQGWNAVVNNYSHADVKPTVFKIPHHGSENAHNNFVWSKILDKAPLSILTVYNKSTKLPKESDILRIVKLSKSLFVVGKKSKKDKEMEHKIRKRMPNAQVEIIPQNIGLVRYRKIINGNSMGNIETFGVVEKYENNELNI